MATPITTIKCVSLTSIDGTDCIGDTRGIINTNVNNLGSSVCTLFSTITAVTADFNTRIVNFSAFVKSLSAKDSSTVDISFLPNSYILSADVVNNSLGTIKLGSDITTFGKRLLTSTNIPLSSLAGVTLTGIPNVGDVFAWDGTAWTNTTQTSASFTVGDKGDIDVVTSGFWNIKQGVVDTNELADSAVETNKINNGAVTTSKLASAVGLEAVAAANIQTNAVTTAKISAEAVTVTKLATDSVTTAKILDATSTGTGITDSKLRHSNSCSVIGRSANSTGAPADIQATTNDTVLIRTGDTLQFNVIPNSATTGSSNNNGNTLVLRDASGNFTTNVVTATATTFGFVGNLQGRALSADEATKLRTSRRIELSGSVVGVANFDGTATATINTTFGNANALTVLGRSTNSTGPIASIAATVNDRVLLRKDNELVFDIVPNTATTGTSAADANTLVLRNSSGDFETNSITTNGNISVSGNLTTVGRIALGASNGNRLNVWDNGSLRYGLGIQSGGNFSSGAVLFYTASNLQDVAFGYGDAANNSTSFTDLMRIKGTGNVGIGTITPEHKLTIIGNLSASGTITGGVNTSFKNLIINGGFDVWQRNSIFTNIDQNTFTADRWTTSNSTATLNKNISRQFLSTTDLPYTQAGLFAYLRGSYSSGSNQAELSIFTPIELNSVRRIRAGRTYTLSFYARVSSGTPDLGVVIQHRDSSFSTTNAVSILDTQQTVTTSWTRYSFTFTGVNPVGTTTCTVVGVKNNTVPAGVNIDITGIQLEEGNIMTPFEQRPLGLELLLCQRFYQTTSSAKKGWVGNVSSGNNYHTFGDFAIPMRVTPTFVPADANVNTLFPGGSPTINDVTTFTYDVYKQANSTGRGTYYFTYTADAEL